MLRPLVCRKEDPPIMVSSFIDNTTCTWKNNLLEECFLPMDCEIIRSIPLSSRRFDDIWAWHYERKGVLTVRAVYRLLVDTKKQREAWLEGRAEGSSSRSEGKLWQRFGSVKVPSKLRIFLWRLAQHSLPTGDVCHHINMATSSSCLISGMQDSWRHSLLECTVAHCV
jgi:hypothetical protein